MICSLFSGVMYGRRPHVLKYHIWISDKTFCSYLLPDEWFISHMATYSGWCIATHIASHYCDYYPTSQVTVCSSFPDDVIKWKHFPRYWPFVRGIHWLPVNSTHKGQWRGALIFSLKYAWINDWVYNAEAGETPSRTFWRHCNANEIYPVPLFSRFFVMVKQWLPFAYHAHIYQVSLPLGCGCTRQIWKWFK